MRSMAILTDVTRCIGCEECVLACRRTNDTGTDAPWRWERSAQDLSEHRWTTIVPAPKGRFVRVHCRHCLEPACASASNASRAPKIVALVGQAAVHAGCASSPLVTLS